MALLYDNCQYVASREYEVLFVADLDLGSAVLRVQNYVAFSNVYRNAVTLVVNAAWAYCNNGAFLWLFLSGIRDNKARSGGGYGFDLLDDNAVFELLDGDRHGLSFSCMNQWW